MSKISLKQLANNFLKDSFHYDRSIPVGYALNDFLGYLLSVFPFYAAVYQFHGNLDEGYDIIDKRATRFYETYLNKFADSCPVIKYMTVADIMKELGHEEYFY
jgi:hypothetical protein